MPQLISNTTKRLYLPSTKDAPNESDRAWVEVKEKLTGGDWVAAAIGKDDAERTEIGLAKFIVNWNFTDSEGKVEPVTPETVHRLELKDYNFLGQALKEATTSVGSTIEADPEQKKTSSSTSTPSIPGVSPQ